MTNTPKQTSWKRFLGAAVAMAAVALMASRGTAALAANPHHRAQMDAGMNGEMKDAGMNGDMMDAGVSDLDAGTPEMQGALRGELLRGKTVPQ